MRSLVLRAAVVALAILGVPKAADAGSFLPSYTGNTVFGQPTPLTDGVVNFGVYHSTTTNFFTELFGASAGAAFQLANPTVDANAQYVYIYSVVNTGQPNNNTEQALITFTVPTDGFATSAGAFQTSTVLNAANTRAAFTDAETTILTGNNANFVGSGRPPNNRRLGPGVVPPGSVPGDGIPDFIDGAPSFAFTPGTIGQVGVTTITGNTGIQSTVKPVTSSISAGGNTSFTFLLGDGQVSTLFFFTANGPPAGYGQGEISGVTGAPSVADVPVPTPEPGTFALIGLGLPLLGWGYARRLRASKAVQAVV
jgi:hypothetical protein